MTQAEKLTDAQIVMTYNHFEHGHIKPQGVEIKGSFTETMGRAWDSEDGGFTIL